MTTSSAILLAAVFVGFLIGLAIGMVPYVFQSLGLYRIMEGRGMPNPWMAWVPVANYYALGAVGDDVNLRTRGKSTHLRIWMLVLGIVAAVGAIGFLFFYADLMGTLIMTGGDPYGNDLLFTTGPMIGVVLFYLFLMAVSVAYTVFYGIAIYRLFQDYCPQNAVLYTVLSLILSVCAPFLIFAVRNHMPASLYGQPQVGPYGMPPQYAPYYQNYGQPGGQPGNWPPDNRPPQQ